MLERDGDHWLGAIALLYAALALGLQILNGAIVDPILFIMVPAAIAAGVAFAVWMSGFRFRWITTIAFIGWWIGVMWTQIMVYATASAAV